MIAEAYGALTLSLCIYDTEQTSVLPRDLCACKCAYTTRSAIDARFLISNGS